MRLDGHLFFMAYSLQMGRTEHEVKSSLCFICASYFELSPLLCTVFLIWKSKAGCECNILYSWPQPLNHQPQQLAQLTLQPAKCSPTLPIQAMLTSETYRIALKFCEIRKIISTKIFDA